MKKEQYDDEDEDDNHDHEVVLATKSTSTSLTPINVSIELQMSHLFDRHGDAWLVLAQLSESPQHVGDLETHLLSFQDLGIKQ